MRRKPIQEQFGERVIDAFTEFARADLKPVERLALDEFSHVSDGQLRQSLAQVFYGVRWIYKLGLALITKDEERAAHVRAQLVDYGSVCEGLLSSCIAHGIRRGHTRGEAYKWSRPAEGKGPLRWNQAAPEAMLGARPFWWLILVAAQFGIVDAGLQADLDWIRNMRNTVHLRVAVGRVAYLNQSKRAFRVSMAVIRSTKRWMEDHP